MSYPYGPPRDGIPRGKVAMDLEDMAVKVLEETERQIDEAYRMGFIEGYLTRSYDEAETRVSDSTQSVTKGEK